ncbi:MAG: GNAT family N-acetyltransferase [Microthrixaceae bacterium]
MSVQIRLATPGDADAVWHIMEPIVRGGDTYAIAPTVERREGLDYWFSPSHEVYVATEGKVIVGTYYLRANGQGGAAHVSNCGYMTDGRWSGRGIAGAMCVHSLERARHRGFKAMQFNFVVSTNTRAVHLWEKHGFRVVGRLSGAFLHPSQGYVDALVMYRSL